MEEVCQPASFSVRRRWTNPSSHAHHGGKKQMDFCMSGSSDVIILGLPIFSRTSYFSFSGVVILDSSMLDSFQFPHECYRKTCREDTLQWTHQEPINNKLALKKSWKADDLLWLVKKVVEAEKKKVQNWYTAERKILSKSSKPAVS